MLQEYYQNVFLKFKLNFYSQIFARFETREASLTVVEMICAEIIHALKSPTVNEFAQFTNITAQNATHRINSLVRKGYIIKSQSLDDKREYRLSVTDKFFRYYNISIAYVDEVVSRINDRFSPEELEIFTHVLKITDSELMPEVTKGDE